MKTYSLNTRLLMANRVNRAALAIGGAFALLQGVHAQNFDAGSDGSLGDVVISANTIIDLPPDGMLKYKTLTVNANVRVNFRRNAKNTPVFILSQGDVIINGIIDVDGSRQTSGVPTGGAGGPGGFDGGKPGFGPEVPPGSGYGPGAGLGGNTDCDANVGAGGGSFGSRTDAAHDGATYGSTLLIPIIGGSGGGGSVGQPGGGGGGGGGAILIASNTRILVSGGGVGAVESFGGGTSVACRNGGSGGAIRLVAPKVEGDGRIDVRGSGFGGDGRIRVDTIDRSNLRFQFLDSSVTTVGGNLIVFPPTAPRLDTIEVAGNAVSIGSDPVSFVLPFGSTPNRTVKIQARDFGRAVPIRVVLTPDSGDPVIADATIDNTTANPAVIDVPVTVPVNIPVTVHAWTR